LVDQCNNALAALIDPSGPLLQTDRSSCLIVHVRMNQYKSTRKDTSAPCMRELQY